MIKKLISKYKVNKVAKDKLYRQVIRFIINDLEQAFEDEEEIVKRTVYNLRQHFKFVSKLTEQEVYEIVRKVYNSHWVIYE